MGYKSQETLGLVKGNARINENAVFGDIYAKSKILLEGEDIESQDAPEKDADDSVNYAKEAKKHVEGSVSNDKGTQAPKPKTGSMESIDDAKGQAKEAKKHVEGSVSGAKIGMGLGEKAPEGEWDQISVPQGAAHGNPSNTTYAPAPTTGEWDKINVPQSADAKKHISMREGIQLGENYFEEMEDPYLNEENEEDRLRRVSGDLPDLHGDVTKGEKLTPKYGMEENVDLEENVELDEYGDEHGISRDDALNKLKK
jgi:hypothetical protein